MKVIRLFYFYIENLVLWARKELEEKGEKFGAAIPLVITGKNHKLMPMTKGHRIAIPFKTDSGSFTIEVALEG